MPLDCSNIPSNISYNCENPWGQNCTSAKRFDFVSLWNYTLHIQEACANDSRLFLPKGEPATPQNAALNQASCAAIAGSGWTGDSAVDMWTQLTTWKLPLVQLIAAFPRPPLSLGVECFVIIHLLGDPIDTIKNLLLKLSNCQSFARDWGAPSVETARGDDPVSERHWKALALLTDAYGEWGQDMEASLVLKGILGIINEGSKEKESLKTAIYQTAEALAADRATKFLPIITALSIFIGAVGIAIGKTASAGAFSETIFINREAHSIASSALYFWVIPAVFLSSVIGVSQTQAAIPRILRRLQNDIRLLSLPQQEGIEVLNERLDKLNKRLDEDEEGRKFYGGIYSWQPAKWQWERSHENRLSTKHKAWFAYKFLQEIISTIGKFALSACLIVIVGTITAMIISGLVPPDGWSCRHIGQLITCMAWILSAGLDTLFNYVVPLKDETQTLLFYLTLTKDIFITGATVAWVIVVQVGYLHRCACYTRWGRDALALPEMPQVADKLSHRISTIYPGIAFASISLELIVIPSIIGFRYSDALRVFMQRDDGVSNVGWFRILWCRFSNTEEPRRPRRSRTANTEEGRADIPELQPTTPKANEDSSETHDLTEGDSAGASHGVTGVEPTSPSDPSHSLSENLRRRD